MITTVMFRIAAASLSLLVVKAEMLESDQKSEHQNHCTSILIADSSIYPGETEVLICGSELKKCLLQKVKGACSDSGM